MTLGGRPGSDIGKPGLCKSLTNIVAEGAATMRLCEVLLSLLSEAEPTNCTMAPLVRPAAFRGEMDGTCGLIDIFRDHEGAAG